MGIFLRVHFNGIIRSGIKHQLGLSRLGCDGVLFHSFLLLFKDFIYLFERDSKRAQAGGGAEGEGEAPVSGEPDAGLDPRTLRS